LKGRIQQYGLSFSPTLAAAIAVLWPPELQLKTILARHAEKDAAQAEMSGDLICQRERAVGLLVER
jgi:hypothetical protein